MMNRRVKRIMTTALCLAVLPLLAGCPEDKQQGGGVGANDGRPGFEDPNPGAQPPAPAADPGPQTNKGEARFQVIWVGERGGHIEYTIGGAPQPKGCGKPTKEKDGKYRGACYQNIVTVPGTTIGFTWFPEAPGMFAQCTLYADGGIKDYQHVQSGSCAVSWVVGT